MPRIAFLIILLLSVCHTASADKSKLKVAAILPLTGKAASVGGSIQNGMVMAYERLPSASQEKLEILYEDDASDSRQAVTLAQRFIADSSVDIIFTALSNTGNAVVPITERNKVPLVSFAYDRTISNGKENAFTFWVDLDALAMAAVDEAARRGYRRVALVTTVHEGNIAMRGNFQRAAKGKLDVPFSGDVNLTDTDLGTHVLRLKKAEDIDGIALLMHAAHSGLFAKNLRENGVKLPLFTLGNFEDRNIRVSARGALNGHWYSAAEYSPEFVPAFIKRFPGGSTFGAAFGHDAVVLLANAAEKSFHRMQLSGFLKTARVTGGAFVKVAADGRNGFEFPTTISEVGKDGIPDFSGTASD